MSDGFEDDYEDEDDLDAEDAGSELALDDDLDDEEDDSAALARLRPGDSLALRRAIELRQEQRRLDADLNYLEHDLDD